MATPAQRLIQDQNLNLLYTGATTGGKTNNVAKADKKGGLGGARKALNDISNSRRPSVVHSTKKENSKNVISVEKDPCDATVKFSKAPEKGKIEGRSRKALTDVTNSVKPSSQQESMVSRKFDTVAGQNVPTFLAEERFLHNHQVCIRAQAKAVDVDYFLETVGLNNDKPAELSAKGAHNKSSSNKPKSSVKYTEMEEIPGRLLEIQVPQCKKSELPGFSSPTCQSPKSPKPPYANWEDDYFSDLKVVETPKLMLYP